MQFAGSSSTGDRRRRRLVVSDGSGIDTLPVDGDGAEIESQLVASAAAAPWVPATELRIWIYASIIGLMLVLLTLVFVHPLPLHPDMKTLADRLLAGSRPRILIVTQTLFLALSTQMGLLIGWYRSRCALDFAGRYRVWPWAVALFGLATFCVATNIHQTFGEVIGRRDWLTWRGETVAWTLPFCLIGLPISILLDRDIRNSRSSLFTLRLSGMLWLIAALLELYRPDLQSQSWFGVVRQLLPVFASATLFVGLWHHARIVAYVCPDPPKLEEPSAWSLLLVGAGWVSKRLSAMTKSRAKLPEEEEVAKPKRRRKKTEAESNSEGEEVAVKRKRKTPVKRTTSRTRTRTKLPEMEDEQGEEADETRDDGAESMNEVNEMSAETSSPYDSGEEWNQEPEESPPTRSSNQGSQSSNRFVQIHSAHTPAVPAPRSKQVEQSWQEDAEPTVPAAPSFGESDDDDDEDKPANTDMGSDQMRGLSKRQRRELKKQQRDQERSRGR